MEHKSLARSSKIINTAFSEISEIVPVRGSTKVVGVFGHPVTHSLSPAMHNAAFAALALPFVYVPFPVVPAAIGPALRSLPALGIVGVNLTIPHKETALSFLDEITEEARRVGAVNTVHCVDGKLLGDNTDGRGFLQPLLEILKLEVPKSDVLSSDGLNAPAGISLRNLMVVVLGAGGAARSVVHTLISEGAQVVLANRTRERAERLALEVLEVAEVLPIQTTKNEDSNRHSQGSGTARHNVTGNVAFAGHLAERQPDGDFQYLQTKYADGMPSTPSVRVLTWDETPASQNELTDALRQARILVNTTRIGMVPESDGLPPIPLEALRPGLLIYDLVYNPIDTRLLQEARRRGCETLTGVKMLVYQGAAAFERWTGVWPPTDIMEQAVLHGLLRRDS